MVVVTGNKADSIAESTDGKRLVPDDIVEALWSSTFESTTLYMNFSVLD